jgi:transposase
MEIPMARHRTPLKLSADERPFLVDFTRKGLRPAREINRARVRLDSTDPTLDTSTLAQRLGVSRATVENVQRRYRRGGLEQALPEAPRRGQPKKITHREAAYLTALACSKPPAGQARWPRQMSADRRVELHYRDAIADESVRRVLKKTHSTPGRKSLGVSAP